MEKTLQEAIRKAEAYGLPMIVYTDIELNVPLFCVVDGFSNKIGDAEYVVLSDGTYEKIGTANIHYNK